MLCCWDRAPAGSLLPDGRDTVFDRQLIDGFNKLHDQGTLRTSPATIKRRKLDGTFGIIAQFSSEHFRKKRRPGVNGFANQVVVDSIDPNAFNFNKVAAAEKICDVEVFPVGEPAVPARITVLANISPLATAHVLLVPHCEMNHPQVMTQELLSIGLHLLARSGRHDFRLVWNSLLGFASVNHFHFHGLYLGFCGFPCGVLPIEAVSRSVITGKMTEGSGQIELVCSSDWYCSAFVITAGCHTGEGGEVPPADVHALATMASKLIQELQKRNIPHNIIFAPPQFERRKRMLEASGMVRDATKLYTLSPEVMIIPRRPEGALRDNAFFNAAVMEVAGLVSAHSEEAFEGFSESVVSEIFRSDVCLPEEELDDLICKVAWFSG